MAAAVVMALSYLSQRLELHSHEQTDMFSKRTDYTMTMCRIQESQSQIQNQWVASVSRVFRLSVAARAGKLETNEDFRCSRFENTAESLDRYH